MSRSEFDSVKETGSESDLFVIKGKSGSGSVDYYVSRSSLWRKKYSSDCVKKMDPDPAIDIEFGSGSLDENV